MAEQKAVAGKSIAIIGAGVIGSAIAFTLARDGWRVTSFDRAPPGEGGASYGNAGHVATELVEPLPAPALLFGFWRDLFALGGVLDIPARRLVALRTLGFAVRTRGVSAPREHCIAGAFRAARRAGAHRSADAGRSPGSHPPARPLPGAG